LLTALAFSSASRSAVSSGFSPESGCSSMDGTTTSKGMRSRDSSSRR
jgi:hypothetical protein